MDIESIPFVVKWWLLTALKVSGMNSRIAVADLNSIRINFGITDTDFVSLSSPQF